MEAFVGVDVSKDTLDVFCEGAKRSALQCLNTQGEAERLAKKLKGVTRVVVEATGGYEKVLVTALYNQGVAVSVVNPRRVRDFAKSLGKLAKTDKIDANVLALFAKHFHTTLPVTKVSSERTLLKELVALRQDLVQSLVQYKNRLSQASGSIKPYLQEIITELKAQVKTITQELKALLSQCPQAEVLQQATGVGLISAATLLAQLPELGRLTGKQVAALAGLAPFNRDSGQYRGKRFCQGGRKSLRNSLYLAANTARRYDPKMKAFYDNLIANGKPFKVAVTACARKLLVILNAKIRDQLTLTA